ncbi:hypothetical protein DM860_000869 [Cuscuta australis]|uniref:Exocyst subunit Exo70 family protein n=1 Tax=Cuscuta australis TaxID=267555 RepID=A0A328CXJ3_9ASTE|nr:hypothetical protein DM860_000869 [Cuscuta australis]
MADTEKECDNDNNNNLDEEQQEEEHNSQTTTDDDCNNINNREEYNTLPPDLLKISQDIDQYIFNLWGSRDVVDSKPPDVPICVEQFAVLLEETIDDYDRRSGKWSLMKDDEAAASSFLQSAERLSKLSKSLSHFSSEYKYAFSISRVGGVLQRAMAHLEEEFKSCLEDYKALQVCREGDEPETGTKGEVVSENNEECVLLNLKKLAKAMKFGAYEAECWHAYFASRQAAVEESLHRLGFERRSAEEVQKMGWDCLEREIVAWLRTFKYCSAELLTAEKKLSAAIFEDYPSMSDSIVNDLSRFTLAHLLDFSNAVAAVTKSTPDKLYKFLDMYEALRDLLPTMAALLRPEFMEHLKAEAMLTRCRLGEMAIGIIQELESTINSDPTKNPVPGGGVHPVTRTIVSAVERACCYKDTLEQVFLEHQRIVQRAAATPPEETGAEPLSPFGQQIARVMELLNANLEAKSKHYKDPSLSLIFMMNNGRYVMQKVRGSEGMNAVLTSGWVRKNSAELRQYHKNYQRETWGRLLQCLATEGLTTGSNGKVNKPVLKERFKSFNSVFDDIVKAQSSWVMSDEQLQSELRVSICNMVVPAYRSFLARFSQTFTPGRQTEKYVKYQGEDLEKFIDELFDGSAAAAGKKK